MAGDARVAGMESKQERIMLETDRHRIVGMVTLASDGYRSRLSDMLNAGERIFIPVTDAVVEPLNGGEVLHHDFVAVSRNHIVFAVGLS